MSVWITYSNFRYFAEPRSDPTGEKIRGYAEYPAGWNFGEGDTFDEDTVKRALAVNELMQQLGFTATDAFPGLSGEIAVTAYKDDYFIQFVVETEGRASIVARFADRILKRRFHISEASAKDDLVEITGVVWGLSAQSTSKSTMILGATASTPWHSTNRKVQDFPFLEATA